MTWEKSPVSELSILLNRPLAESIQEAAKMGFVVRLVEVDGEPYSISAAPEQKRVNFKVQDGIVVEVGVG